jgi:hypothetical protein
MLLIVVGGLDSGRIKRRSPAALGLHVGEKRAADCSARFQSARRAIMSDSHSSRVPAL